MLLYIHLYDRFEFWVFVCAFAAFLFGLWIHQHKHKEPNNNILWLLPDDTQAEHHVEDLHVFVDCIRKVDRVSLGAMSYTIDQIELLVEDDLKLAIQLKSGA